MNFSISLIINGERRDIELTDPRVTLLDLLRERLDWRGFALQVLRQLPELLHLPAIDGLEQRLARRKVAVERADADTGPPRHGFEARLRAAGAEDRLRRFQHALAIAERVGAGLAEGFRGLISHGVRLVVPALDKRRMPPYK